MKKIKRIQIATHSKSKKKSKNRWEEIVTYIKTAVDMVNEPFLILDPKLKVLAGNDAFYETFQTEQKDTVGKLIYTIGNGQWNIPTLRKLLEEILPKNSFFKGFEVAHNFPHIGRKVMIVHGRRIGQPGGLSRAFPQAILLAIEDITDMVMVAEKLAAHTSAFELSMADKTARLELRMQQLAAAVSTLNEK